jgi:hypothetical protein
MIRQDQNNTGSQVGQYGLNPNAYRTNPAGRSAAAVDPVTGALIVAGLTTALNQGGSRSGSQTTTQQNLPDWAIPYAQNTMNIGSQFTMNPNYRPSTLDRDYSGIRGYTGPPPTTQGSRVQTQSPVGVDYGQVSVPDDLLATLKERQNSSRPGTGLILDPNSPGFVDNRENTTSRGGGRQNSKVLEEQTQLLENPVTATPPSGNPVYIGYGRDYDPTKIYTDLELNDLAQSPTGEFNSSLYQQLVASQTALKNAQQAASSQGTDGAQDGEEDAVPFGEMLTPFSAYDRQRFAAPSDRTTQGETLLANRVNGPNPFAEAQAAARGVSNYRSQFTPAALNLTGPTANTYNNVNQGLLAEEYGNANQGLTPAQNYSRAFQENLAQFQDPYTSQVVNQTIQDLDRARRITNNDISGNAARAGAFGGSREALMRTENNRNFADRTAAAVGQLRSQGFQQAAERAQQEQLQRLGLTASDIQNLRGYQSAGNLQGQNISAQDVRDVRGLQSQGALTAQGLGAQSDRDAMGFQNQLQMQGNQLGVEQARLAEQFRQGAGALNLQGAGALGNLAQMQTADERQRIADLLAAGAGQDNRNQQDLDFIYNEFQRELGYPMDMINLRNAAISPATNSVVTTSSPLYGQNPLLQGLGAGLSTYSLLKDFDTPSTNKPKK